MYKFAIQKGHLENIYKEYYINKDDSLRHAKIQKTILEDDHYDVSCKVEELAILIEVINVNTVFKVQFSNKKYTYFLVWMEPQDGNSSDRKSFSETISRVNAFKKQININAPSRWVGDSALYSKEQLLKETDYVCLTRVPETIKEAKELVEKASEEVDWVELGPVDNSL